MINEKLLRDVRKFLDVYKILSPEARAAFEAQIAPVLNTADPKSKKLYEALLSAAKDGLEIEDAILKMEEAAL